MKRRLPPLNSMRAFEAAARLGSFVDAGNELAVTPSAISQQVKTLEDWLGCALFRRLPRGLELTSAGRAYLPSLTEAFDSLDRATNSIRPKKQSRMLKITCLASFGAQWLTPRLHKFDALHPDIDILLATFDRLVDLETEDVDIAIRYGTRQDPNLMIEVLGYDELGIVCSPDLIDHPTHPIREMADIAHHPLLHDSDARNVEAISWEGFLGRLNLLDRVDPSHGPRFSDSHMMIQSCIAGRGVMIGRSVLIADALEQGVLVAPFGMPFNSKPHQYRMAMLPGALQDPKVAAFRAWIFEEMGLPVPDAVL